MGGAISARARLAGVALLGAGILAGCSPPDESGLRIGDDGRLEVVNCGTHLRGVSVVDAASQRVVWAAELEPTDPDLNGAAGHVVIGVLPNERWVEVTAFDPGLEPFDWRVRVTSFDDVDLAVRSDQLEADEVLRPDGSVETRGHFDEETCSAVGIRRQTIGVALGALVPVGGLAVLAMVVVGRRELRRERLASLPPPPSSLPPPPDR